MRIILIAMKKYLLLVSLFLLGATATFAETTFVFKKVSSKFDVKISVENCDDDICDGKATVYLMKKNQLKPFQTIQLEETHLQLRDGMKPNSGVNEVLDSSVYGVYFEDYNFDGAEDLALSNGTYAPYGGISHNVYLFTKTSGKFVFHRKLSEMATDAMGIETDKKTKTLETFTKSGCCWHQTVRYKFFGNRLVKIYSYTEDAINYNDGKVRLITERFVGKKWKKTTKVITLEEYNK